MRFLLLGLILAGCAHQRPSYSLGDELTVMADGLEVTVRNDRQPILVGANKTPLSTFEMRPRADYAVNHCYEGAYNAVDAGHPNLQELSQVLFVLCKDPESANDANAFFIGIKPGSTQDEPSEQQQAEREILFTAHAVAGAVEVKIVRGETRTVLLPPDFAIFAEHPEYAGALVALGIWTADVKLTSR